MYSNPRRAFDLFPPGTAVRISTAVTEQFGDALVRVLFVDMLGVGVQSFHKGEVIRTLFIPWSSVASIDVVNDSAN